MTLSREDQTLYDRQIRLWGLASQQKIREATICFGGMMTGVAQEIIKNLTLKGIKRIIILDWPTADTLPAPHTDDGMLFKPSASNLSAESLAETVVEQATALNPTTTLEHVKMDGYEMAQGYLRGASAFILINDQSIKHAFALDAMCQRAGVAFFWLLSRGRESLCWSSLGLNYKYSQEIRKTNAEGETTAESREENLSFAPLAEVWEQHRVEEGLTRKRRTGQATSFSPSLKAIQDQLFHGRFWPDGRFSECAPVNSILGGVCAQEVVKVVTGKDRPVHNIFLFDGNTLNSTILSIPPTIR